MRRKRMKFISMALSVVLGLELAMTAIPAQAAHADYQNETQLVEVTETLPSKYSSIDLGFTTRVRNQGNYGNCWAHSAIGCLEIAMVKDRIAEAEELELSIPHGVYYYYRPVVDPLGGTAPDYATPNTTTVYEMLHDGGYASFVGHSTLAWQGPVLAENFLTSEELLENYNIYENADALHTETFAYGNRAANVVEMTTLKISDLEDMKRGIIEYGSIGINYNSNGLYYNSEHSAQFCPTYEAITHAVTVVGWDDNFSKENFKQTPLENGAWLVKNSYGTGYGQDGYFWISYEDKSLSSPIGFKVVRADKYDNNYQYNGVTSRSELMYGRDSLKAEMVNVFTIQQEDELLKAVQFYVGTPGIEYSIQVYKNLSDVNDPLSGQPLLDNPLTGVKERMGFYTLDLEQPVWLKKGETIAVCVSFEPQKIDVSAALTYDSLAPALQNQSFYRIDGATWRDCADENKGNFFVRAFTSNAKDGITKDHEHVWTEDWEYDGDYHWRHCEGAGTCDVALSDDRLSYEKHYGGTATCNERAVCVECNQAYGTFSGKHVGEDICEVCGEEISYLDREKTNNPFYELTTLDGETVSTQANGKPKLIILYGAKCGHCVNTMASLVSEKLTGVDICALDVNGYDRSTVESFRANLAGQPGTSKIQFCYNPDICSEVRSAYTNAIKEVNPDAAFNSLPGIFYVDAENNLRHMTSGTQSIKQIKKNLITYCGYEMKGLNVPNPSDLTLTTIEETQVSLSAQDRPKVLMFYYAEGCTGSRNTIRNFASNLPEGVDFVAVEIFGRDKEKVTAFKEEISDTTGRIQYTYGDYTIDAALDYMETAGLDTKQFETPILCYIDSDNVLQYVSTGECTNGEMRMVLQNCCDYRENVDPDPTPEPDPDPTPEPDPDPTPEPDPDPTPEPDPDPTPEPDPDPTPEPDPDPTPEPDPDPTPEPDPDPMPEPDPTPVQNPFMDVEEEMFFYNPVLWAVENKITSGLTPTTFGPFEGCTRGEIVTFLYRAMNGKSSETVVSPFTDVDENAFYYNAVLWAVENKITAGVTPTIFAPDRICTRAEIVTFLYRAVKGSVDEETTCSFKDVKEDDYYYDAVLWAVENEVTTGVTPDTFVPEKECTRGECVSFLYRLLAELK